MKVSAEQKAKNREAILNAAARLIREKGPSGIGVAEVMAGAGLTHGGFYNHFTSREDLAAQALDQAIKQTNDLFARTVEAKGIDVFLKAYLSEAHLDNIAKGCPFAATATEMTRQPESVRKAFASGLREYIACGSAAKNRAEVISRLSAAIGALALARAVVDEDRQLALELLSAATQKVS
ncbi:TetR/AcrR family transcriptional regulator [Hyphomonas sp.]|uniref:TetR/AcrR family transcriptional regulator n=1 Tax=Hyphomonas sp. TaxID=87 RepID=UPI003D27DE35